MNSRFFGLGGFVISFCLATAGCDWPNHNLRRDHDKDVSKTSDSAEESDTSKVLDVQSDPAKPKSFFKPSRLSGGLSDEAREIEKDMGIK